MRIMGKIIWTLVILVLVLQISCAGGSTRGTGGIRISGTVLDDSQQPVADMLVAILQSGDQTTTNSSGEFALESSVNGDIDLLFEKAEFSAQTRIAVPDKSSVTAIFEVNTGQNSVSSKNVEVREDSSLSGSKGDDSDEDEDDSNSGRDDDSGDDDSDDQDNSGIGSSDDGSDDDKDDSSDSGSSDDDSDDDKDDSSGSGSSDDGSDDDKDDSSGSGSSDDDSDNNSCDEKDVEGAITAISNSALTVSGVTYAVDSETEIEDGEGDEIQLSELKTGDVVQVKGDCAGALLIAKDIRIED